MFKISTVFKDDNYEDGFFLGFSTICVIKLYALFEHFSTVIDGFYSELCREYLRDLLNFHLKEKVS